MRVPKFIKKAIQAVHIDEESEKQKQEKDKRLDENADKIRIKEGLTPSKKTKKVTPEVERLKERIKDLERQIEKASNAQAKKSQDIFIALTTGQKTLDQVIAEIT